VIGVASLRADYVPLRASNGKWLSHSLEGQRCQARKSKNAAQVASHGRTVQVEAGDEFPARILPVILAISATGATTLDATARALNDRGIRSPRGGQWHVLSVMNLLARTKRPPQTPFIGGRIDGVPNVGRHTAEFAYGGQSASKFAETHLLMLAQLWEYIIPPGLETCAASRSDCCHPGLVNKKVR
jgi:hypothetical protein